MLLYFIFVVVVFVCFLLFSVCPAGYRQGSDGKKCEGITSFNCDYIFPYDISISEIDDSPWEQHLKRHLKILFGS